MQPWDGGCAFAVDDESSHDDDSGESSDQKRRRIDELEIIRYAGSPVSFAETVHLVPNSPLSIVLRRITRGNCRSRVQR